jgi:O-antigen/teichoic acid export membrane protein
MLPDLFQTSLWVIGVLGLLLAGVLWAASDFLTTRYLKVPDELIAEVRLAIRVAACAIPFAILAPCLIATLEAHKEFRLVNLIRIPTSASYLLAPLVVLPFTSALPWVIVAMTAGRLLECTAFLFFCLRRIPGTLHGFRFSPSLCKRLLSYGGWMTVTNLLLPLMIHGDRFILGAMGLAMVTYYMTPAEFIVRLLVLPRALVTVLFPNFTMGFAKDPSGLTSLTSHSIRLLLGALVMGGAILIPLGPYALELWIGPEFRGTSGTVLRWLTLGITFLGLAYIPRFLIQSSGKPFITALLCIVEVPIYLSLAYYGVSRGGVTGIATAWCVRCAYHMVMLYLFATPRLPGFARAWRTLLPRMLLGLGFLGGLLLIPDPEGIPWNRLILPALAVPLVWWGLFAREERQLVLSPLLRILPGKA